GTVGLEQGFTLAPGLRLDLAYEHVFNNISSITAAGTQFVQPFAVGSGASSLLLTDGDSFSVGLSYTDNPDLQASARLEHRSSSQGSNTVFTASALGRLSPAVSVLFNYELASAANQSLDGLGTSSTLKLGLAYRDPHSDQFNALLRYEYRGNPSATPETLLFGSDIGSEEHLFTAEAIYAPNWRWEFYGKYAFRTSTTRIGGIGSSETGGFDDFVSNSAVHLAQFRTTYRLGYDWDVVGEARWIGSSAGYTEMGAALELGYYPTPDLRLSAGYSFGSAYDRDFTGSNRSAGGFYFGITAKLNSLFGGFGLQEVAPPQQQESVLEAAATNN
ncbi:MAG: TonB-dependent receptor, partial [Cyanobacteria bacterium J06659_2]